MAELHFNGWMWLVILLLPMIIRAIVSTRMFHRTLAFNRAEWNVIRFEGLRTEMPGSWI